MCGIVAVLRRPSRREPPTSDALVAGLDAALAAVARPATVAAAASAVEQVDASLRGVPGVRALLGDAWLPAALVSRLDRLEAEVARIEGWLDSGAPEVPGGTAEIEGLNAALLRVKDAAWALRHDRLRTAVAVGDLAGPDAGPAAIEACTSVQTALSAIDRLEVRGRDSAGVHVLVEGHGLDLSEPDVAAALAARTYGAAGSAVIDVADSCRKDVPGRYRLDAGEDGTATCRRTDDLPDLALDVAELGAAYLGGVRLTTLQRAGLVSEITPGAVARADALFATPTAPACLTGF